MVQDWRSNPSPSLLPQYPSPSLSGQHTSFRGLNHSASHEPIHRRLSDVQTSGLQQSYSQCLSTPNSSRPPPSQQQDTLPYDSNTGIRLKRSTSHSPPSSFALGPAHSPNSSSYRGFGGSSQHADNNVPDSAVASKGSSPVAGPSVGVPSTGHANATDFASAKFGKDKSSRWHFAVVESSGSSGGVISSVDSTSSRYTGSSCSVTGVNRPGFLGRDDIGNGAAESGAVGLRRNESNQSESSARRNVPPLGDGIKSLPSLKASGLLDAWGSHHADSVNAQKSASESPGQIQPISPRRMLLDGNSANISKLILPSAFQSKTQSDPTDLRPTSTIQPVSVGPPWLTKESR